MIVLETPMVSSFLFCKLAPGQSPLYNYTKQWLELEGYNVEAFYKALGQESSLIWAEVLAASKRVVRSKQSLGEWQAGE